MKHDILVKMKRPTLIYQNTKPKRPIDQAATAAAALAYRKASGLSQEEVAGAIGLSSSLISYLETADRKWTEDLFKEYIAAIDRLKAVQPA